MTFTPTIEPSFNPFPGLRAFEADEEHLFFGRETQIDDVLKKLRQNRFLAVVGASGSGKSSLVRSGILPALQGGYMAGTSPNWRIALFRPGSDPIQNLAHCLSQETVLGNQDEDPEFLETIMETTLRRNNQGIVQVVREAQLAPNENVLILVDQFEETFRFADVQDAQSSQDDSTAFVKLLLEAFQQKELPIYVVLTMRSDFLGDCTRFFGLPEAINEGQYLIPRMTRDERKIAISGPVSVGGGQISNRLLMRLLNDIGDNHDQLPILQHALMRTWDHWTEENRADGEMDLEDYEAIGTMADALSLHADEAFEELSPELQALAERIFRGLTEKGEGGRGIRRPASILELTQITGGSPEDIMEVIEVFRKPGRSFLMPPARVPLQTDTVIDISHESLMRVWKRLILWVEEETNSAKYYLRLCEAAEDYYNRSGGLWRNPELQLGLNWREETQPNVIWAERYHPGFEQAMAFLDYSKQQSDLEIAHKNRQQQLRIRRSRIFAIVLGSASIVSLLLGIFAMVKKQEADLQREEAVYQKDQADSLSLVAIQEKEIADQERNNAVLARTEAEIQRDSANFQRQQAIRQRSIAVQARRVADRKRRESDSLKAEAIQTSLQLAKQKEAIEQKSEALNIANTNLKEQQRLIEQQYRRSLAVNGAISAKNLYQDGKREEGLFLALQTHQLHVSNAGQLPQPEIFDVLWQCYQNRSGSPPLHRKMGSPVRAVTWSAERQVFAIGTNSGEVQLLNSEGSVLKNSIRVEGRIRELAFSPDGTQLAIGQHNGRVYLWNLSAPAPQVLPGGLDGVPIKGLAFAGDQHLLFVGPHNIGGWHLKPGLPSALPSSNAPPGIQLAGLEVVEGRILAFGGAGSRGWLSQLQLKDPDSAVYIQQSFPFPETSPFSALAAHAPSGRLALGQASGRILLCSLTDFSPQAEFLDHTGAIHSLDFSRNGQQLASASADKSIRLWEPQRPGAPPVILKDHRNWVWALAYDQSGSRLLSGSEDRNARFWVPQQALLFKGLCQREPILKDSAGLIQKYIGPIEYQNLNCQ